MKTDPQKEHLWLSKFVGEWKFEGESPMEPGQPPVKFGGTESARTLADLWMVAEGKGQMPDGKPSTTIMTLGYNPQTKRYTGTWIGSMMDYLWIYDGELDANERVLSLLAKGPSFSGDGKMAMYRDVIEFHSDDHRTLSSHVQNEVGTWNHFMTAHYHRTGK